MSKQDAFERDYLIQVAKGKLFWLEDADQPHNNPAYYVGGGLDPNIYIARPLCRRADADEGDHQVLPPDPLGRGEHPHQSEDADAGELHQIRRRGVRRVRRLLHRRCEEGVRQRQGQGAAEGFRRRGGRGVEGDGATSPNGSTGRRRPRRRISRWAPTSSSACCSRPKASTRRSTSSRRRARPISSKNQDVAEGRVRPNTRRGKTIQPAWTRWRANKPAGNDPVAEARRQIPTLKAFVLANDIVSIPGTEQALVEESPPYNRQNSAYIDPPGPFDKGIPSVYYISPPDPSWPKAKQARLRAGQDGPAVHLGPRSDAGAFRPVPPRQPLAVALRAAVRRLCLCRRLGALCRGDDVGRGARQRRRRKRISARSATRCCAIAASCRRSGCTRAA